MKWNWQQGDWPRFRYDAERLAAYEADFLRQGGVSIGAFKHLQIADQQAMMAEALISEAITTSAIEGEILDRDSVRASVLSCLGLDANPRRIGPRERGISHLTVNVLQTTADELSHEGLFAWHRMLMEGRADLESVGGYRTDPKPMQIVSVTGDRPTVHFEAPPSDQVPAEMSRFLEWFDATRSSSTPLARAGIAHLRFESVHPFEDGNGRLGRAIAEKALSQGLGQPSLILLATEIEARRKGYYAALESASRCNEVSEWLVWFAEAVLAAQARSHSWIEFLIAKTKLLDGLRGKINGRQEQALLRMMREGPPGFEGGLSAGNYQRITGASPATAGRDLAELAELGVLRRSGVGKGTRYWLRLAEPRD